MSQLSMADKDEILPYTINYKALCSIVTELEEIQTSISLAFVAYSKEYSGTHLPLSNIVI